MHLFYVFLPDDVKSFLFLLDFEHLGSWNTIWSERFQISKNKEMRTSDVAALKET